jgi:Transmembrane protein 43
MARRKRKTSMPRIAIVVAALALVGVGLWFGVKRMRLMGVIATVPIAADHVDAANEGRKVSVAGRLEISKPARDPQLGISADAPILFRDVSMFQWREHCDGSACRYETGWLRQPVDSHKFRVAAGHENPPFPFADAHFAASEIQLGAFTLDPDLLAASSSAVAYPVHATALPPNLAATFREVNGVLATGNDSGAPAVGEVHVSYRIVPLDSVSLTGVQRGAKLTAN